jgi:hypothetical protein
LYVENVGYGVVLFGSFGAALHGSVVVLLCGALTLFSKEPGRETAAAAVNALHADHRSSSPGAGNARL